MAPIPKETDMREVEVSPYSELTYLRENMLRFVGEMGGRKLWTRELGIENWPFEGKPQKPSMLLVPFDKYLAPLTLRALTDPSTEELYRNFGFSIQYDESTGIIRMDLVSKPGVDFAICADVLKQRSDWLPQEVRATISDLIVLSPTQLEEARTGGMWDGYWGNGSISVLNVILPGKVFKQYGLHPLGDAPLEPDVFYPISVRGNPKGAEILGQMKIKPLGIVWVSS